VDLLAEKNRVAVSGRKSRRHKNKNIFKEKQNEKKTFVRFNGDSCSQPAVCGLSVRRSRAYNQAYTRTINP
jgi:hypothetical protein